MLAQGLLLAQTEADDRDDEDSDGDPLLLRGRGVSDEFQQALMRRIEEQSTDVEEGDVDPREFGSFLLSLLFISALS